MFWYNLCKNALYHTFFMFQLKFLRPEPWGVQQFPKIVNLVVHFSNPPDISNLLKPMFINIKWGHNNPNNILLLKKSLKNCYNNENSEEMHYFDQKTTKMAAILFLWHHRSCDLICIKSEILFFMKKFSMKETDWYMESIL